MAFPLRASAFVIAGRLPPTIGGHHPFISDRLNGLLSLLRFVSGSICAVAALLSRGELTGVNGVPSCCRTGLPVAVRARAQASTRTR